MNWPTLTQHVFIDTFLFRGWQMTIHSIIRQKWRNTKIMFGVHTPSLMFGVFLGQSILIIITNFEVGRFIGSENWLRYDNLYPILSPYFINQVDREIVMRLNIQPPTEIVPVNSVTENERKTPDVKILCWIMTYPANHYSRAVHVKNTWGSHCDKLLFMSSEEDKQLGAINLNVSEGRQNLWGRTKRGFQYCYQHHREEFHWFVKADDDTFMVIENLREFLTPLDTNEPIHFGHNFKYLGVRKKDIFIFHLNWCSGILFRRFGLRFVQGSS